VILIGNTSVKWQVVKCILQENITISPTAQKQESAALGLLLFTEKSLAEQALDAQKSAGRSELFSWILLKDSEEVQIVDNVRYCPYAQAIWFLFSRSDSVGGSMKYGILIDFQHIRAVSNILSIALR
jgi:hypothetical protein